MKITTGPIKKYQIKIVLLLGVIFILWIAFKQYQVLDQAVFNPPEIGQTEVSARQEKVNTKLFETIRTYQEKKVSPSESAALTNNPFESHLDITSD